MQWSVWTGAVLSRRGGKAADYIEGCRPCQCWSASIEGDLQPEAEIAKIWRFSEEGCCPDMHELVQEILDEDEGDNEEATCDGGLKVHVVLPQASDM